MFALALPVLGEQFLNALVGTFDTFLAGRIGPSATSAIGLAAYVGWLVSMIAMLVGTGTAALVSRHVGANKDDQATRFANESISLAIILGAAMFLFMYMLAPAFAHYCQMTGEAESLTVHYLRTEAIGHVFMTTTLVGCAAMRGAGDMRTPMVIFSALNVVNIVTSCALVYGIGPLPELGVHGIVAGTVIARACGAVFTIIALSQGRCGLILRWRLMRLTWERTYRILRIGIPAAADGAIMWASHFMFLRIIAGLAEPPIGEAYFAAHIIAIRVEALTYLPAVAWATASATIIGQALGAEDPRRARRAAHFAMLQCGALSLFVALTFFVGADVVYQVMSSDALVRKVGADPFRYLAWLQPILVASIVYIHALRGAGDTRFPLLITVGGAVCRLSCGYIGGIALNGGLLGAWMGMFADNIWRGAAACTRYIRGNWVKTRI